MVALGDLTNGALNYYKATEAVKVKRDIILDHIIYLQEKVNGLQEEKTYLFNKLSTENKYLQEENERLKKDKGRVVSEREDLLCTCISQDEEINNIKKYINTRIIAIKKNYNKTEDIRRKVILYACFRELHNLEAFMDGKWDGEKLIDKGSDK